MDVNHNFGIVEEFQHKHFINSLKDLTDFKRNTWKEKFDTIFSNVRNIANEEPSQISQCYDDKDFVSCIEDILQKNMVKGTHSVGLMTNKEIQNYESFIKDYHNIFMIDSESLLHFCSKESNLIGGLLYESLLKYQRQLFNQIRECGLLSKIRPNIIKSPTIEMIHNKLNELYNIPKREIDTYSGYPKTTLREALVNYSTSHPEIISQLSSLSLLMARVIPRLTTRYDILWAEVYSWMLKTYVAYDYQIYSSMYIDKTNGIRIIYD